jgi:hypothetical protein
MMIHTHTATNITSWGEAELLGSSVPFLFESYAPHDGFQLVSSGRPKAKEDFMGAITFSAPLWIILGIVALVIIAFLLFRGRRVY